MTAKGTYFPRRINQHVPNMQYAADVRFGGLGTIVIPAPSAADADGVQGAIAADAAANTSLVAETDAKFGRNVTVIASAATGAATLVAVRGRDYLGQPMAETMSIGAAVTTSVGGKKAFKYVEGVEVVNAATNAVTIDVGWGNVLGLPYKSQKLVSELVNKEVPGTAGTFVDGAATGHTGSLTSDDPRGTYTPHSSVAPNGSREYELTFMHDTQNLHGDAHFYS